MKTGTPNLNDVARQAGVSKSTVSRILNNRLGNGFTVREEVRRRVLEVARQMHYRPNLIAKSLTLQSTGMIHILGGYRALRDLGNIYQTVVNHITECIDAAAGGYDVTVSMSRHVPDAGEMPAWKVDGVIILATCSAVTLQEIARRRIPCMAVNGPAPDGGLAVVPDDVGGMRAAVDHLVELGHTRIAYSGPLPAPGDEDGLPEQWTPGLEFRAMLGHSSVRDRGRTYLSRMRDHGLEPMFCSDGAQRVAEHYLKEMVPGKGATAVITYGHMGALNLLQGAHSLGIAVPGQVSIMGFCDDYANRVMSPGLTFIDLGSARMGTTAAQRLLDEILRPGQTEPRRLVLEETLVQRNTTAPPPK